MTCTPAVNKLFNWNSMSVPWIWDGKKPQTSRVVPSELQMCSAKWAVSNLISNKWKWNNCVINFYWILNIWIFGAFIISATVGVMPFHLRWLGIWADNWSLANQWELYKCSFQSWKFNNMFLTIPFFNVEFSVRIFLNIRG